LTEIDSFNLWEFGFSIVETPISINSNDPFCTFDEGPLCCEKTNWTHSPYPDDVAFVDACVDNAVVTGGENIAQVDCLFIRNTLGDFKEIDVAKGETDVFGLATCLATGELAVSEHTSRAISIHCILDGRVVGSFAHGGNLLFAKSAFSACNLERRNNSISLFHFMNI
jgi:hypothetical protein